MSKYFSNVSSKCILFFQFFHISFFPAKFLYKYLYLNKFVQVNFVIIILHVYILYIILYLNKLYNFQFSLSYCDLDLTCYY